MSAEHLGTQWLQLVDKAGYPSYAFAFPKHSRPLEHGKRQPVFYAQSYISDLTKLGEVNGLTSIIYSLLTASFVGAGFGYIFLPTQVSTSARARAHQMHVTEVKYAMSAHPCLLIHPLGWTAHHRIGLPHTTSLVTDCARTFHSIKVVGAARSSIRK